MTDSLLHLYPQLLAAEKKIRSDHQQSKIFRLTWDGFVAIYTVFPVLGYVTDIIAMSGVTTANVERDFATVANNVRKNAGLDLSLVKLVLQPPHPPSIKEFSDMVILFGPYLGYRKARDLVPTANTTNQDEGDFGTSDDEEDDEEDEGNSTPAPDPIGSIINPRGERRSARLGSRRKMGDDSDDDESS